MSEAETPDDSTDVSEESENGDTVDPELVEALRTMPGEDRLTAEAGLSEETADNAGELAMAEAWFPNDHEWQGKTIIHPRQAQGLAASRQLVEVFPELEPIEDELVRIIENYEMYLTSIDGRAREQQTGVLKAMLGSVGHGDGDGGGRSILSLFANPPGDDDD